jgi:hypothetical protein
LHIHPILETSRWQRKDGDDAPKFSGTQKYGNNNTRDIYTFQKREACLMAIVGAGGTAPCIHSVDTGYRETKNRPEAASVLLLATCFYCVFWWAVLGSNQ